MDHAHEKFSITERTDREFKHSHLSTIATFPIDALNINRDQTQPHFPRPEIPYIPLLGFPISSQTHLYSVPERLSLKQEETTKCKEIEFAATVSN